MIPALLTIKSTIQHADVFETTEPWVCLKADRPRCYLISDADIAREILKDETIIPEHLLTIWKRINRLNDDSLPQLTKYFERIPLLISGSQHVSIRNSFRPIYQSIEKNLDTTLKTANKIYFTQWQNQLNISVIDFLTKYIEFVNKSILANELAVDQQVVPGFGSASLFSFTPSVKQLMDYDKRMSEMIAFLEESLKLQQRPISDVWPLVSVAVMGQEPLLGALAYGLLNARLDHEKWSGEDIAYHSAPVSVISRNVTQHVSYGGLDFERGDLIVISPIICHRYSQNEDREEARSIAFGHGPHICTGRKIVTKILDHFFEDIHEYDLNFDLEAISLRRRLNLTPIKKPIAID